MNFGEETFDLWKYCDLDDNQKKRMIYYRADEKVNKHLKDFVFEAAKRYRKEIVNDNKLSVGDFSQLVMRLKNNDKIKNLRNLRAKFLFVDEFQDTDKCQMEAIVWLNYKLKSQLFVVGDVKQSIYRFRGANDTAFKQLGDIIGDEPSYESSLEINYRTKQRILDRLNPVFNRWMEKEWLEDVKPARSGLTGNKEGNLEIKEYAKYDNNENYIGHDELKKEFKKYLGEIAKKEKDGYELTVLVRDNKQVKEISEWCCEEKIPCVAIKKGDFYRNEAVIDMFHLLGAILYPEDMARRFNYLMTPYSTEQPDIDKISEYSGDASALSNYLKKLSDKNKYYKWSNLMDNARKMPFFQLLRTLIDKVKPVNNYCNRRMAELIDVKKYGFVEARNQARIDGECYRLNLNKLMQIFFVRFSGEFSSIWSAYTFLDLHIRTDYDEEEVPSKADDSIKFKVSVMTVHKSKGLQFDHVVITHMDKSYWYNIAPSEGRKMSTDFLIYDKDREIQVGWLFKSKGKGGCIYNDCYDKGLINEIDEKEKDEVRLLYVAMTRAKNNLTLFKPVDRHIHRPDYTWARLYAMS